LDLYWYNYRKEMKKTQLTATEITLIAREVERLEVAKILLEMFGDCISFYSDGRPKVNGNLMIKKIVNYL